MSLSHVRPEFVECPTCEAKPGSPELCRECLERRELYEVVADLRRSPALHASLQNKVVICSTCKGTPNPECKEHGR